MAFPEALRVTIRKRAHLRCCLCKSIGVDIHHIVPQSEGGLDVDENAAPLCPSCHETYGANPQKRKFIREARDLWYEICAAQFSINNDQLTAIAAMLEKVATKDDIERFAVQNVGFVLGASAGVSETSKNQSVYSFEREEFVHPLIVRELLGWLSDRTSTVVAVDLTSSNRSNRYFGEFSRSVRDGRTWVEWVGDGGESFAYAHIATSPSGIQMVECYDRGGGTGVFGSVGLFSVECDQALEVGLVMSTRTRVLLKTLGCLPLGDRYSGEIVFENGVLTVGPDSGWFRRGKDAARTLLVR